jgi:hypothetical protein
MPGKKAFGGSLNALSPVLDEQKIRRALPRGRRKFEALWLKVKAARRWKECSRWKSLGLGKRPSLFNPKVESSVI